MQSRQRLLQILFLSFVIVMVAIWTYASLYGYMPYIDQWTRDFVPLLADSRLYLFARWITDFGSYPFLIPFTVVMGIGLWWLYQHFSPALIFSGGTLLSYLSNHLIKLIVARERPSILVAAHAQGYSFPSGHAMISIVCYGLFTYFVCKKVTSQRLRLLIYVSFSLLIFWIGMSRYIINVHYLTDVLAGFGLGFILLSILVNLFKTSHDVSIKIKSDLRRIEKPS